MSDHEIQPDQEERRMLNEFMISASARMTFHEFLFEIIVANDFAPRSDAQEGLQQFREQFLYLMRYKMSVPDSAGDESFAIQEESVKLAERFFDKTSDRITNIQEIMKRLNN